jgi:hypothetical protein
MLVGVEGRLRSRRWWLGVRAGIGGQLVIAHWSLLVGARCPSLSPIAGDVRVRLLAGYTWVDLIVPLVCVDLVGNLERIRAK